MQICETHKPSNIEACLLLLKLMYLGGAPVISDQFGAVVTCEQSLCTDQCLLETVSFVRSTLEFQSRMLNSAPT